MDCVNLSGVVMLHVPTWDETDALVEAFAIPGMPAATRIARRVTSTRVRARSFVTDAAGTYALALFIAFMILSLPLNAVSLYEHSAYSADVLRLATRGCLSAAI